MKPFHNASHLARSCEDSNELSNSKYGGEFLHQLCDYLILFTLYLNLIIFVMHLRFLYLLLL